MSRTDLRPWETISRETILLEDQALLLFSRAEIERALREGAFKVVAWTAAVALALNFLETEFLGETRFLKGHTDST